MDDHIRDIYISRLETLKLDIHHGHKDLAQWLIDDWIRELKQGASL